MLNVCKASLDGRNKWETLRFAPLDRAKWKLHKCSRTVSQGDCDSVIWLSQFSCKSDYVKVLFPGLTFSWKRAIDLIQQKQKIAREIGIPMTKQGFIDDKGSAEVFLQIGQFWKIRWGRDFLYLEFGYVKAIFYFCKSRIILFIIIEACHGRKHINWNLPLLW